MTKRGGLRERKRLETRRMIEEAGLSLFESGGFAETTVADIAEQAHVATRTLFRYFDTKDQVLFADHERRVQWLRTFLRSRDELTIASTMDACIEFFTDDLTASVDRFRLQLRIAAEGVTLQRVLYQHQADLADVIATELQRRELARPLDADVAANAIMVAIRDMSLPWLLGGKPNLAVQLGEARARLREFSPLFASA